MIAVNRRIFLTFLYFSSYILNSHVECQEWQRQVFGELLRVNGNFDQAIKEYKDRMNEPKRITCPELNNAEFTNEYPNHVIGVPECGDKQNVDIDLYVHGDDLPCQLNHYFLPNQANSRCLVILKSLTNLKKIFVIVHGHGSSHEEELYAKVRDRIFLDAGDKVAILAVGYGTGRFSLKSLNVLQTIANTRYTSYASYMILKNIYQELDSIGKSVTMHCGGHSLGAQICGNIGKLLIKDDDPTIKMLDGITALDPAGQFFHNDNLFSFNNPVEARLNKNDAKRVIVWHTDGRASFLEFLSYGTMERAGHVDLYPGHGGKYGYDMPGCGGFISDTLYGCSHSKAIDYYSVSINMGDCFKISNRCEGDPTKNMQCTPVGDGEDISAGFWQDVENETGMFTIEVMANYPYCT